MAEFDLCHGVFALADKNSAQLTDYSDARLADLVKEGSSDAFAELTARYMYIIRAKAASRHFAQLETDDLCQEGLLGLLSAARTYNQTGGAAFKTYAGVCIENRLIMAYRAAASRKNAPFSDFVSLSESVNSDLITQDGSLDPETILTDSESANAMWERIKSALSNKELQVLKLYLGGCSYAEIAQTLSITEKASDNALQRVRMKLKKRIDG